MGKIRLGRIPVESEDSTRTTPVVRGCMTAENLKMSEPLRGRGRPKLFWKGQIPPEAGPPTGTFGADEDHAIGGQASAAHRTQKT